MLGMAFETLLDFLFPQQCAGCRRAGALWCAACQNSIRPYPDDTIALAHIAQVRVVYVYDGALREAIHQLKYHRRKQVGAPLGRLLAQHFPPDTSIDGIVPVPIHARRLQERGFNQAEVLARPVAAAHQLPVCDGLIRTRDTEQQIRLTPQQRRSNLAHAFAWSSQQKPPRRVLLLDDVLTTGATAVACAATLIDAGSSEVHVLALARSRPHHAQNT